jgi:2-isopropylmalate synthase
MSPEANRIIIFDTTLRDGEQSPGVSLNLKEKVMIARALEKLGVDVIEAGFPISSPGDFAGVQAVAGEISGATVCGLARCLEKDITRAWEAIRRARKPRIHVFLATSKIHRQFKLRKAEEEILRQAVESVKLARSYCKDVEFSPEDASRTEPNFLAEVVEAAIAAGASTVNIPDTVGYAVPDQFGALIGRLRDEVPEFRDGIAAYKDSKWADAEGQFDKAIAREPSSEGHFDKGSALYGIDLAKDAIRDAGFVVIVEGYMDALMALAVPKLADGLLSLPIA